MLAILQVPAVSLPKAAWVERFFDVASDPEDLQSHLASKVGWDLREALLPRGDEEIRLWYAPTDFINQVLCLRKRRGEWSAEKVCLGGSRRSDKDWTIRCAAPKSGWKAFWRKADGLGIRTLPDDSELPQKHRHRVSDGTVLYVELQADGKYRAYRYDNPQCQDEWPEAKRMEKLFETIEAEFPRK